MSHILLSYIYIIQTPDRKYAYIYVPFLYNRIGCRRRIATFGICLIHL